MTNVQDDYTGVSTMRNIDEKVNPMSASRDEKDDLKTLKARMQRRKKPIYAVIVFLILGIIGISIGVSTSTKSTANTESAQDTVTPSSDDTDDISKPVLNEFVKDATADEYGESVKNESTNDVGSLKMSSLSTNGSEEGVGKVSFGQNVTINASLTSPQTQIDIEAEPQTQTQEQTPTPSLAPSPLSEETPLPSPSGNVLSYSIVDFDWTDASKWEYASGAALPSSMITSSGITLTSDNSAEPIRTKEGWSGEKVVYIEWERSSTSDTNIWMLNTKLQDQFGKGNGWPYWGELDLFEMFAQDAINIPAYDHSGFGGFTDVSSYGQLTMHMGPATEDGSPCFCPASPVKSQWYKNTQPMTSGCTAQFSNDASNSIAAVWGSDSTGKYIQLFQNPAITKGGKLNDVDTYDITGGTGPATSRIYNNADLFWGVDATSPCAAAGGHDATSGFPFFENFRLVLEEQKKGDSSASFTVKKIQIFTKN
ncbi:hypothetical protein Plhal703r1_c24g0103841 [Plasmopara halstedii]